MGEARDSAAAPSRSAHGHARLGLLTPHAAIGPEAEFREMAAHRVIVTIGRLGTEHARGGVGSSPPSSSNLAALSSPELLAQGARRVAATGVDAIGYASTTTAYAVGFEAEAAMAARLTDYIGVPVASSCAAAVLALRTLEVSRVALIGAPWFDPSFNALGSTYFEAQGFDVVSSESAMLAKDPEEIDAAAVVEWTAAHVTNEAEAIFIGGTGFRVVGAITPLERMLGRPVLTANQVLLWQLLAAVSSPSTVAGYGELFEHQPSTPAQAHPARLALGGDQPSIYGGGGRSVTRLGKRCGRKPAK
jgi:maleate isomerase